MNACSQLFGNNEVLASARFEGTLTPNGNVCIVGPSDGYLIRYYFNTENVCRQTRIGEISLVFFGNRLAISLVSYKNSRREYNVSPCIVTADSTFMMVFSIASSMFMLICVASSKNQSHCHDRSQAALFDRHSAFGNQRLSSSFVCSGTRRSECETAVRAVCW